jgi:ribosomal protein L13E
LSKQPKNKKTTKAVQKGRAEPKTNQSKAKEAPKTTEKKILKTEKAVPIRAVPAAIVYIASRPNKKTRLARGFSLPELRTVGLDSVGGRKLGLMIDPRRSTEIKENLDVLKKIVPLQSAKSEDKSRKAGVSKTQAK